MTSTPLLWPGPCSRSTGPQTQRMLSSCEDVSINSFSTSHGKRCVVYVLVVKTEQIETYFYCLVGCLVSLIIQLYCHFQHALHVKLECSLALTRIVPIYTIKLNMANKYIIYSVHNMFFKMIKNTLF